MENNIEQKNDVPLNVVLYQPEIAANVGAIGRTCVGLGAKLWLIEPLGFQIDDRKLKRAGLDYWPNLNYEIVPNWECLKRRIDETSAKSDSERRCYYLTKKGARSYDSVSYRWGDFLVFGPESSGLPESFITDEKRTLRIPIKTQIRSLNISVSVAIVGFEARRQLQF